jgi:hypothetical protein
MEVSANYKPMTLAQEKRRLKWLRKQMQKGVTGFTLADLGLMLQDDMSRWSEDDKAHARAQLNKRFGWVKDSDGKPN